MPVVLFGVMEDNKDSIRLSGSVFNCVDQEFLNL